MGLHLGADRRCHRGSAIRCEEGPQPCPQALVEDAERATQNDGPIAACGALRTKRIGRFVSRRVGRSRGAFAHTARVVATRRLQSTMKSRRTIYGPGRAQWCAPGLSALSCPRSVYPQSCKRPLNIRTGLIVNSPHLPLSTSTGDTARGPQELPVSAAASAYQIRDRGSPKRATADHFQRPISATDATIPWSSSPRFSWAARSCWRCSSSSSRRPCSWPHSCWRPSEGRPCPPRAR